jgi:hypothetical protein
MRVRTNEFFASRGTMHQMVTFVLKWIDMAIRLIAQKKPLSLLLLPDYNAKIVESFI